MNARLRLAAPGLGLPLLMIAGCALVAAPQSPSLKLPEPVTDLAAQRTGDQVELHWTMPKRDTDKVLLTGSQKVEICRSVDAGPCAIAGTVSLALNAPATYTDSLPADLSSGARRPLAYTVILENQVGRSAGPSNSTVTAAGSAPPPIQNLQARAQADGVVLTWTAENGEATVRIHRVLAQKASAPKPTAPLEQTLEYSGKDQGRVLDRDAALDHTYTYTAQRIMKLTLQGKSFEVASAPGQPITIDARDLFPPAAPQELQAVADPKARAIDLSWQPDTEADLGGYLVYRRDAGSNTQPVRISPSAQPAPSFRDANVMPGHSYEYSVSAVDQDGNESPRSAEVEETLPQQ
jgi:hypothetical protein